MPDVYYRDTKKALEEFDNLFNNINRELNEEYGELYNTLFMEVQGLLDEYNSKLDDIEHLQQELEEYKDDN